MVEEKAIDKEPFVPFQESLTAEEAGEVLSNTGFVTHRNHELVFRQHTRISHVMFVRSGLVKVYREGKDGRTSLLKIATRGEFIGLISTFGNGVHQCSAASVSDSEVGYVDRDYFNGILKRNGEYGIRVIRAIGEEGLFFMQKLTGQSHKQLPGRIADVILYFSETIFKSQEFDFPLTRRELAEMAGTTKESFIRTLAEFRHDRIIGLEGRRVTINSMKIIRTLSDLG